MDVKQFERKMEGFPRYLMTTGAAGYPLPDFVANRLAVDALADIKDRIIGEGERADGGQFKPYSTKPIRVGKSVFYVKSGFPSGQRKKFKNGKYHRTVILESGYKEFRELQGRQTAHKDFSMTGAMWKSIHLIKTKRTTTGAVATVGTNKEKERDKLEGNSDREGIGLLEVSENEKQELVKKTDIWLEKAWEDYFK